MSPRTVRILPLLLLQAALIGALPTRGLAARLLTGDEEVTVPSTEVIDDDLIVWSPYVRIEGVVKGDLVVFGEQVVVEGIVEQDLIAVGKTVYLGGQVNDDARIAAYAVALGETSRVADDLFDLSYSLETKEGARIGGTLHAASKQLLLAGPIVEDVRARAGALELRGLVGGDVRAVVGGLEGVSHSQLVIDLPLEIPDVDDGIRVASTAVIGGTLDHRSLGPAVVEPGAEITGGVHHEPWRFAPTGSIGLPTGESESFFPSEAGSATRTLAILLVVGLLIAVAAPAWLSDRAEELWSQPAGMLGWGIGTVLFGLLASFVIGIVFLVVMTIGLAGESWGLAWTAFSAGALLEMALFALLGIALLYVGPVLASAGIGDALLSRLGAARRRDGAGVTDAALFVAVGAVVYTVLRALPWIGWLFGLGAALVGLGVIATWLRASLSELDAAADDG